MSIRNNEERLGAKQPDVSPPAPQIQQQASSPSTFSFVTPTEFVELPSKGRFYERGHPLCGQETIEIKHMTAKEEDLLTSRSLLKKGLAINRVLQNIVVNKAVDVNSLLIGDKNAVIIAARISAYGADYETQVSCPACATSTRHTFNLYDLEANVGGELEEGVKRDGNSFFVTLPKTNVRVKMKLLDGKDEKFLSDAMSMKKKKSLPDSALTDQFRMFIVSVNDHTDNVSINSFIETMPASDSRYLRTVYDLSLIHI